MKVLGVLELADDNTSESEDVGNTDQLREEFDPAEVLLIGGSPVKVTKVDGNGGYVEEVEFDDAEVVETPVNGQSDEEVLSERSSSPSSEDVTEDVTGSRPVDDAVEDAELVKASIKKLD